MSEWVDCERNIITIMVYSAIHVGSHWKIQDTKHIKNTDNTQTKHNPVKASEKQSKQNYPGSGAFCDTWPENEVGLYYNAPEPTRGLIMALNIWSSDMYIS